MKSMKSSMKLQYSTPNKRKDRIGMYQMDIQEEVYIHFPCHKVYKNESRNTTNKNMMKIKMIE